MRNEQELPRGKEEIKTLHKIKGSKANYIGHILRRNCILKHVIEGKVEGRMGRGGRINKKLLDDFKKKRRCLKLKEETLDHTLWRTSLDEAVDPS